MTPQLLWTALDIQTIYNMQYTAYTHIRTNNQNNEMNSKCKLNECLHEVGGSIINRTADDRWKMADERCNMASVLPLILPGKHLTVKHCSFIVFLQFDQMRPHDVIPSSGDRLMMI